MRLLFFILFSVLSISGFCTTQEFKLSNGLKILVREDHRAPIAVSMLWYNVGSSDEPGGITGVSHAIEHIMFKGTPRYPLGVFSKTIASVGGQENAFTNYDYTVFFEKVAASQLPLCFELEADRMQNLLLDKAEFGKEIKVIREERRMRTDDNPQAHTFERYLATAHLSPPYQHPVIGWMSDLYQMQVEDLKDWYQRYYAPDNATLVVIGDVNPEAIRALAEKYFGAITKRANYVRRNQKEPPVLGPKTVLVNAPAQLPLLMFGYTVPGLKTAKEQWEPYALDVIGGLLGAADNGRFARELVRGSHVASDAQVYYNTYARYQTQFVLFGTPSQDHDVKALKQAMQKQINKLQTDLIDKTELDRIKTQIIAQKIFERDSIFGQAMEMGLAETIGIGWQKTEQYSDEIRKISPEQIQAVARRYFSEQAMTQAELIPETKGAQE